MLTLNKRQREYLATQAGIIASIIFATIVIAPFVDVDHFSTIKFILGFSVTLLLYVLGVMLKKS